jgi:hypothetical protein
MPHLNLCGHLFKKLIGDYLNYLPKQTGKENNRMQSSRNLERILTGEWKNRMQSLKNLERILTDE